MARYLMIVESPTKVKTIKKFIGSNYEVMASSGHVRDLPKSQMGFDPENDFEPKYITIRGKGSILTALRKEAKKADRVYLATDPDREGEAISWHLIAALGLELDKTYRITFNEITKSAVKEALKHPRGIDMNMVDAQQARRVLDRMVGYRISPLLWEKVKRGLSAGRVQSVALRIIADREKEISEFIPVQYWTLDALFRREGIKKSLSAQFFGDTSGKIVIGTGETADKMIMLMKNMRFSVTSAKRGERIRRAPLPFTTSTMQQESAKALNFPTQKTMRVAQQLYEGIDIEGKGTIGLITYLRTDSTRISEEAHRTALDYIAENYGRQYAARVPFEEKKEGGTIRIQDAHEAIRPSDISITPRSIKHALSRDQLRLYELIWKRFIGSCMAAAKYETIQVRVTGRTDLDDEWNPGPVSDGNPEPASDGNPGPDNVKAAGADSEKIFVFTSSYARCVFDGYLIVYQEAEDNAGDKEGGNKGKNNGYELMNLREGDILTLEDTCAQQHFTQPVPHYTEASLVHTLEENGIGRPSTYAPTITTLLIRHYVTKQNRCLYMTELGEAVNSIMKSSFPDIDDVKFTAKMETLLDKVADGKLAWKSIIHSFYPDLDKEVRAASKSLVKVKIDDEQTDVICDKCGRHMVIKYGPYGKFLGCSGFPQCRNTMPFFEKAGVKCPLCGQDVIIRRSKKGRRYFGCENPECGFISWTRPSDIKCPKCGSWMAEKGNRVFCQNKACGYSMEKGTG